MSLYKQKDSSTWFYDFTVDGRLYRRTTKTTSETRALTIEAELRNRAREKGPNFIPMRRAMTLRELAPRFIEWFKSDQELDHDTRIYYTYGLRLLERSSLASMQISLITADMVNATVFTLPERVSKSGKLISPQREPSPKYINQAICTLTHMLTKAKEWHLIAEVKVLKKREAFPRNRYMTPEDEAALLKVASQPLRDVLTIAMDTGMRPFEIFRMRWEDVLWNSMEIFIPKSKTKAGRRRVPISTRMSELLLKRFNKSGEGWVFPAKRGDSGHLKSVAVAFRNARTRAGLDHRLVLYSARHAFGTHLMRETGNLPLVMQAMGHASVQSTLPYQHHENEQLRSVIEARNSRHSLRHSPQTGVKSQDVSD